ncbi:MAG: hydroxyacylglutathione hydrolase [Hyphomicrobiaceae bacterium]
MLEIHLFPCLSDNYGVLVREPVSGLVASIDAPEARAVEAALAEKRWTLTHILTTHHHHDHTDGNLALKAAHGCTIIGPRDEAARVPGIDTTVGDGDVFQFGAEEVRVIGTPGHTAGHISLWMPGSKVAFVGDTLFVLGCGRVIEGSMQMMWESLAKLAALPRDTRVYCGHEYTLSNAKFALTIEPENAALAARSEEAQRLRASGRPTVPTEIGLELDTNPFLRPQVASIRTRLGMTAAADWQVFGEIRERKNRG